jgi:pimeloyl-ACP methyl ester carboxylesterase
MRHRISNGAGTFALVALFALELAACKKSEADSRMQARQSVTLRAAELPAPAHTRPAPPAPPPRSREIELVDVPEDQPALVIRGEGARPIVYLHGMCSEPRSDLEAWGSSVSAYGTVIGLVGDTRCASATGNATWTNDPAAIDARIGAAIDALRARGVALDPSEMIVIGESLGASRAEALASRFPARYTRVILVGAPQTPSPKSLGRAKAIALLAGEREPQEKMLQGTAGLEAHGLAARFWELPGATHGTYGPEGARAMAEAVAFVAAH